MSVLVTTARFVGDLDSEFYADERQREVWNEASAVGFQVLNWALVIAAAILPWAAGRTGAWIALGLLVGWVAVSFLVLAYARALEVDLYVVASLWTPRSVVMVAVYLVGALGVILRLVLADTSDLGGTIAGGAVGAALAAVGVSWGISRTRRKARDSELARDAAESQAFEA
ncbi:hypothetical protein [Tomitella biformata]|uniref:hypothetical protein n=1 Tax=Tomitella biformata TaxID=630403 RepID=UPI0004661267|nr:hypothetical protein [Tomitella biformata]